MNMITNTIVKFFHEEDGAQVVEYALIIAVISIGLVLALGSGTNGLVSKFTAFVTRIGTCLTTGTC